MTGTDPGKVRAYALAGSAAIEPAAAQVETAVRTELGIADRARLEVAVHGNGFIDAFDTRELWERTAAPTLPDARGAETRAQSFLAGIAKRLAPLARGDAPLIFVPPLPARPLELVAIRAPGKARWDHWLYRTQPQLTPASGQRALSVFGAQLEVRVGHGGAIVGFSSRWRPITGQMRQVEARALDVSADAGDHGTGPPQPTGRPPESTQVYVLDGAVIPQHYLAPYHLVTAGHHYRLVSASALSLTVDFALDDDETGTTIRAVVDGGSGSYDFDWCAAPLADPLADRIDLGSGSRVTDEREQVTAQVQVPKGAWIAIVHVIDRETGAFKHHQQHVFSSPFAQRGEAGFAVPDPADRVIREFELAEPTGVA